ncbi:MAG: carboxypeptidase-like regulatory domain-containing protein [Firmicutes bacterium]|nr:carboxypeptidase-like regulatory domain-containing protein [Bacillota bacterium]
MDRRSIGEKRIPVLPTPFEITIQEGEEKEIAVGVVRSASLAGRIARFGPEERGLLNEKGAPLLEKEGLANVVVELQSEIETLRCVTDSNGSFFFEELRPGKWRLRIYEKDIPPYHYVEENNLNLNLEPGEAKELFIKVLPVERPVTIIEEMDLPLEGHALL